jgi:anti-sigma B factor antagonist
MTTSHDDATPGGAVRPTGATLGALLRPRGPIQLALTTRNEPQRTVVGVSGELDILTVSRLSSRVDEVIRRRQGTLVIDLSEAEFIDSMGLHALLNVQRRLIRQRRTLIVICPPGAVRHAIELARLAEPLGIVSSAEEYELRCASP